MSAEQARLDLLLREVYGSVPKRRPRAAPKPFRACPRCGILTRRESLCVDCAEVLAELDGPTS